MRKIAIIGGGAAGMACAVMLARKGNEVDIYERGERLGRKLSATGNGQGNVTNVGVSPQYYFSDEEEKLAGVLAHFSWEDAVRFLESMGGVFLPDARGRVYPAGRQASAVTDLLRRELARLRVGVHTGMRITALSDGGQGFRLAWEGGASEAERVVLAAGGCAAPNFGTDGTAYALAQRYGHTVTALSPVLVQLRTDPAAVRGLKGIRVDAGLRVMRGGTERYACRGDVLFTESGVSGDAVFRASSYAEKGDVLLIDFLPDVPPARLKTAVGEGEEGLLCIVNNGLGRQLCRRAEGKRERILSFLKQFPLTVTGTLGFGYAQATRGGIPLAETDAALMSIFRRGLYFAGEILNADGACGGFNLHWAWASAHTIAEALQ